MEPHQIRQLILGRRKEFGIGLSGRYNTITRWLFHEHNVVTSDSWVAKVITDARQQETNKRQNDQ